MKNGKEGRALNAFYIMILAVFFLIIVWMAVLYDSVGGCVRLAESFDRPAVGEKLEGFLQEDSLKSDHAKILVEYFQSTEEVMAVYVDSCGKALSTSRLLVIGTGLLSFFGVIVLLLLRRLITARLD
jgi:hypothetical protein